jgi:hypothetical protein
LVYLVQQLVFIVYKQTLSSIDHKLNNILKILNLHDDPQLELLLREKLLTILQDNSLKVFPFQEELKLRIISKYEKKTKKILKERNLEKYSEMLECCIGSEDFEVCLNQIHSLCLYMTLCSPQIIPQLQLQHLLKVKLNSECTSPSKGLQHSANYDGEKNGRSNSEQNLLTKTQDELESNEEIEECEESEDWEQIKFEFMRYKQKYCTCIDGFAKDGAAAIIVLSPPKKEGMTFRYLDIKPSVIIIPHPSHQIIKKIHQLEIKQKKLNKSKQEVINLPSEKNDEDVVILEEEMKKSKDTGDDNNNFVLFDEFLSYNSFRRGPKNQSQILTLSSITASPRPMKPMLTSFQHPEISKTEFKLPLGKALKNIRNSQTTHKDKAHILNLKDPLLSPSSNLKMHKKTKSILQSNYREQEKRVSKSNNLSKIKLQLFPQHSPPKSPSEFTIGKNITKPKSQKNNTKKHSSNSKHGKHTDNTGDQNNDAKYRALFHIESDASINTHNSENTPYPNTPYTIHTHTHTHAHADDDTDGPIKLNTNINNIPIPPSSNKPFYYPTDSISANTNNSHKEIATLKNNRIKIDLRRNLNLSYNFNGARDIVNAFKSIVQGEKKQAQYVCDKKRYGKINKVQKDWETNLREFKNNLNQAKLRNCGGYFSSRVNDDCSSKNQIDNSFSRFSNISVSRMSNSNFSNATSFLGMKDDEEDLNPSSFHFLKGRIEKYETMLRKKEKGAYNRGFSIGSHSYRGESTNKISYEERLEFLRRKLDNKY